MTIHADYDAETNFANLCVVKTASLAETAPESCDNCFASACLPEETYGIGRACHSAGWGALKVKNISAKT